MKTRHIYGMLAGTLIALSTAACSDNYDTGYEPIQKTLELKVDGHESAFSDNYNAAQRSYDVNVESNTLWRVEANSEGGWISLDKVSGRGNESFTFTLRDNMIAQRQGTITVYMVNAQGESLGTAGSSIALTVVQEASSVQLSPSSLAPFKPTANDRTLFTVTANVAWTLDVSYEGENPTEFISITPETGDMQPSGSASFSGDGEASFYMSVADNRTSSDRKAYLNLKSDGNVGSYSVEISQTKSEYNFDVSPAENQTVGPKGGEINFGVLAIVGWTIRSSVDWVSFSPSSHATGSEERIPTVATIAPNPTGDTRTATIRFEPNDSRYSGQDVTIIQRGWDTAFEVTPKENRVVGASGGTLDFSVLSMVGWSAVSSEDWISFSLSSANEANEDWVPTVATVAPNQNGTERSAILQFIPGNDRYETVSINVTQRGYDLKFEASQAEGSGIIQEAGGSMFLNLDSRFRWQATAPSWLRVNPNGGDPSASSMAIEVSAVANTTNDNRTGTVTVTPLPTEFAGGVTLDPAALGIESLHIGVTQFGGRNAAISVPWLRDGYTDRRATVEFNFYSPFHDIVEAGLEWGRADSDQRQTVTVTPADPKDSTVSFELTGLSAATRYVARGYVKDAEGNTKYGDWSYPFTTGGQYPGANDNPTPSR